VRRNIDSKEKHDSKKERDSKKKSERIASTNLPKHLPDFPHILTNSLKHPLKYPSKFPEELVEYSRLLVEQGVINKTCLGSLSLKCLDLMKDLNILDLSFGFYLTNYPYGQSPRSKLPDPGQNRRKLCFLVFYFSIGSSDGFVL